MVATPPPIRRRWYPSLPLLRLLPIVIVPLCLATLFFFEPPEHENTRSRQHEQQFLRLKEQTFLDYLIEDTTQDMICDEEAVPSYQVCNGLSNQLLGHAAYIARIIESKKQLVVNIPNAFIINGVQTEPDGNVLKNVFATKENSVSLSSVIDARNLLDTIRGHGINPCLVPHEKVVLSGPPEDNCNWLGNLVKANDDLALELLNAIRPSDRIKQSLINNVSNNLQSYLQSSKLTLSDGMCLHHRNGTDWHNHCSIWPGNNCLEIDGMSMGTLLYDRIPNEYPKKWVYYIGDEEPKESLVRELEQYNLQLMHRGKHSLLDHDSLRRFLENVGAASTEGPFRDIEAVIDFFVCNLLDSFVGNSVSTFSALQINLRRGKNSTWYNSRGIPLDSFLKVHRPPLVYTYSELSDPLRQNNMKESILSAQNVLGSGVDIHVMYHGSNDGQYLDWLKDKSITVHKHEPKWLTVIAKLLKQNGSTAQTHLTTWQKIDIPLFINAEYAIFLDDNVKVTRPFTLSDLGLDITTGIAFSNKGVESKQMPQDPLIMLGNVPRLRRTYNDFISFITDHAFDEKGFVMSSNVGGAYLDFYGQLKEGGLTVDDFYEQANEDTSLVRFFDFDPFLSEQR